MEQQRRAAVLVHFDDAAGQQQVIAYRPLRVAGTGEMGDRTGDARRGVLVVIQQCQAVEAVAHLRIGEAPGQCFLVGRTLSAKRVARWKVDRLCACSARFHSTKGGCSETGTNELMVRPTGLP